MCDPKGMGTRFLLSHLNRPCRYETGAAFFGLLRIRLDFLGTAEGATKTVEIRSHLGTWQVACCAN